MDNRNFGIFIVIRLAGALGLSFVELFAGVANWHIRPLALPEFLPGEAPTKAERDQLLIRLWSEGRGEQEIAEALDLARASIGPYVRELRDVGEDLPTAVHRAARLRLRRAGGGKAAYRGVLDRREALQRPLHSRGATSLPAKSSRQASTRYVYPAYS